MKNSHLSKYKLTAFALTALIFIPFMSSSGWATIIKGNLEVKAGTGTSSSNGDLTVDGTTSLKGTTIEGSINANNTLTVGGTATLNGSTTLGNDAGDTITINGSINAKETLTVAADKKLTANGDLEVGGTTTLNGPTNLKGTNITGDLAVSGTLTVGGVTHASVPVGTVIWHVGICGTTTPTANTSCTCPSGYLKANGDPLGSEYTTLRELLGTTLPDLRGEFIRGWSDDRGNVDANREIRSFQDGDFKAHKHDLRVNFHQTSGDGYLTGNIQRVDRQQNTVWNPSEIMMGDTGGVETRPRNIALLGCIKY